MYHLLIISWLVLGLLSSQLSPASGPTRSRCFGDIPAITACLTDPFFAYWDANGGLPVLGYPITGPNLERNRDLVRDLETQWTERNRIEIHPENGAPYNMLLGRMGAERLTQLGRPTAESPEAGPRDGCLWFAQTGHNVCDQSSGTGFKTYWQTHGLKVDGLNEYNRSLQLFGLPLTAPHTERNTAGDTVETQWFERARFEWHPDKPAEFKVLLGLLGSELRNQDPPPSIGIFGAEAAYGTGASVAPRITEARLRLVRYNAVQWNLVEPTRGARNWDAITPVSSDMQSISAAGGTPLLIVRGTPPWAQKVPGSACGPIKPEALDAYAQFMAELVGRYSVQPYNVHYWELGNEVDVDPSLVPSDSVYGCWGNAADPYYGGGYYAEMLKRVYGRIKQADPTAQVSIGGLLLDCDPASAKPGDDCRPATFLEGILRNGGGAAFDFVAYHAYTYWAPQRVDWDRKQPDWQARGGVTLGKLAYIHDIMRRHGVVKPVLMDEGGLLCYPSARGCPAERLAADQANHLVRLYGRSRAGGLSAAVWYTLNGPGFREGGLLDAAQSPRPAFTTLKFLNTLLDGATYVGPTAPSDAEGYQFRKGPTTYTLYWTNTDSTISRPAPNGTTALYGIDGARKPFTGSTIDVGFTPIIVESNS
ncbi:MAG: hypothetical protein NVS4B8_11470 [Herpetosiphon sp.]